MKRNRSKKIVLLLFSLSVLFSVMCVRASSANYDPWTSVTDFQVHDVATTSIVPSKTIVGETKDLLINVTVTNEGDFTETFNVTAYANTTVIETKETTLSNGTSTTITFTWRARAPTVTTPYTLWQTRFRVK